MIFSSILCPMDPTFLLEKILHIKVEIPLSSSALPQDFRKLSNAFVKDWGQCCSCGNSMNEILKAVTHHASPCTS